MLALASIAQRGTKNGKEPWERPTDLWENDRDQIRTRYRA